jgi:3'(2'), 5'-bisphosphate nucleotidase
LKGNEGIVAAGKGLHAEVVEAVKKAVEEAGKK